jgi:hypothetical protein
VKIHFDEGEQVFASGAEGRRFESCRVHPSLRNLTVFARFREVTALSLLQNMAFCVPSNGIFHEKYTAFSFAVLCREKH